MPNTIPLLDVETSCAGLVWRLILGLITSLGLICSSFKSFIVYIPINRRFKALIDLPVIADSSAKVKFRLES